MHAERLRGQRDLAHLLGPTGLRRQRDRRRSSSDRSPTGGGEREPRDQDTGDHPNVCSHPSRTDPLVRASSPAAPGHPSFRPARPSRCATRAHSPPTDKPLATAILAATRACRDGRLERGSVPALGRSGSGQDPSCARARARSAGRRERERGGDRVSHRAADQAVGARRRRPRSRPGAGRQLTPAADRLSRRLGDLRPDRQGADPLGTDTAAPHSGDRRRGTPPGRGADLGRGVRQGVCVLSTVAAAVGNTVSLRRHPDPRGQLRRRGTGRARRLIQLRGSGRGRDLPAGLLRGLRRHASRGAAATR